MNRGARLGGEIAALWLLAWPIMVGQLANVGMSVADVAMAGHASAQDLAGVSLGVSVWNMVIITLMGIMMAVNPLVAHHVGAQELDHIPHVVRQALWKGLLLGLLAALLLQASVQLFEHMALEPLTREVAVGFVQITSFSLPAFAAYRVLYGYSASLGQTKPMMVVALGVLLLNILINWVLVFGHWGFAPQGGLGCAWSTMLCVWANLGGLLWWMRRSPAYASTWPFTQWEWPHAPKLRSLLKMGLPIGVTYFAETSAFALIALLVARFGSAQVAAHQIALNFTSLIFMVPLSLGTAVLTRVGQALGAGQPKAARFRAWVGVASGLGFAVLSAAGIALLRTPIASLYTEDTAVVALATQLLLLAAVFQLSDAAQVVTAGAIRGYKITRAPMWVQMLAFWGVSLPLGYLLGIAPEAAPAWLAALPGYPAQAMQSAGFWLALVFGLTVGGGGLLLLLRQVARAHVEDAPPPQNKTSA
ncbi:MAG: MATE family efflux transporter [Betaproteobacteria bacterium]